ncbi:hypothetical protein [Zavarzinella formosa]|uniref:hypothetical protein n=1 Tax=Zavarzinella formosa TaxID=360055 RepID=UPI0002F7F3D6|nr:hypothetical protein [Zavarzinella formosa]
MRQIFTIGILLAGVSAWAQSPTAPAAKLALPLPPPPSPTVRAAGADFWDDGPQPSARLGPLSADIGKGPADADDQERYNWGAPRRPAVKDKDRDRDRDRDSDRSRDRTRPTAELASRTKSSDDRDRDDRSARLREPTNGKLTNFNRGSLGDWWDENTRDVREGVRAWGDKDKDRLAFESDCAFQDFVSPISNPFLAEDPRALTELRPIYIYQTIPKNQYLYQGGNAQFFGLQGRLALTERFSVVVNKLGGNIFNPGSTSPLDNDVGLSEIWLAPKFAFWRDVETQTLATGGLMFQIPVGGKSVYQDTGSLSLVPYVSYGQRLWRTGAGTFSVQNTVGYSFGTNNLRSDYLYDTAQLSLDVLDSHRFYPVIEMSWFHYTSDGKERPYLAFEGRDLANIGAPVKGRDYLTIAPGFRFNLTQAWQFGVSTEFPLLGTKDLMKFRLGVDVIWRY